MKISELKSKYFAKHKYLILAALMASVFLVVNIANLSDYGETVDEVFSVMRGSDTAKYIAKVFETGNLDFKVWNTQISAHPPFFSVLNYWFSVLARGFFGMGYIESYHLLIVIISSIGLFFVFLLARAMFNERVGLYSLIFLIFFPRFIAHSQYNQKDIPIMAFLVIAIFFLYLALKKSNKDYSILAGLFAGMSIDSKLDGLFIFPIFLLSYFLYRALTLVFFKKYEVEWKITIKKFIFLFLVFLITAAVAVFLFWPYLWKDPSFIIKSLKHFSEYFTRSDVLYFGKLYSAHDAPWHYVIFSLFMITPVITLLFFLTGLYVIIRNQIKGKKIFEYLLLIFWFLTPLLVRALGGGIKYDADRQILSIIPAMAIIAALGLDYLFSKMKFYLPRYGKKIAGIIFIIIVIILFKEVIIIHPFEGGYVNETIRLFIPAHIEKQFYLDYWGSANRQGMAWLNKNAEPNSKICLGQEYLGWHLPKRKDLVLKCDKNNKGIDYLMNVTRFNPEVKYPVVFKISIYNSDLLYIYKVR